MLIVDDHPIIVAGCAAMLAGEGDIEVFDARDAEAGLAAYVAHGPDAAVVDIALPGASGFELTRRILRHDPRARVVVFSMNDDAIFAARAIEAGAKAYVTKNDDPYLLLRALREVMAGGTFIQPKIADRLGATESGAKSPLDALERARIGDLANARRGARPRGNRRRHGPFLQDHRQLLRADEAQAAGADVAGAGPHRDGAKAGVSAGCFDANRFPLRSKTL